MDILKEKERLNKLINSDDLDVRIAAKRKARELGFALVFVDNKYELMLTKAIIMKYYYGK